MGTKTRIINEASLVSSWAFKFFTNKAVRTWDKRDKKFINDIIFSEG